MRYIAAGRALISRGCEFWQGKGEGLEWIRRDRLVTSLYMIVDIQAGKTEFKFLLRPSATQVS
jgi:hypothetical protein